MKYVAVMQIYVNCWFNFSRGKLDLVRAPGPSFVSGVQHNGWRTTAGIQSVPCHGKQHYAPVPTGEISSVWFCDSSVERRGKKMFIDRIQVMRNLSPLTIE
jgi:hypothetical protein